MKIIAETTGVIANGQQQQGGTPGVGQSLARERAGSEAIPSSISSATATITKPMVINKLCQNVGSVSALL